MYTVPQYSVQVVALCCFCAQVAGTTFRRELLGYRTYKSFRDAWSSPVRMMDADRLDLKWLINGQMSSVIARF